MIIPDSNPNTVIDARLTGRTHALYGAKKMIQTKLVLSILFAALSGCLQAQEWIPAGAKVCFRSHYEDGFLPDATFCLKLKITKEQFDVIVKKTAASLHTEDRKYGDDKGWLKWSPDPGSYDPFAENTKDNKLPPKAEKLWDPDPDLSTTFVWQQKDTWRFLKYERGYLYYKEVSH